MSHLSKMELQVVVLGENLSGKTSVINTLLGQAGLGDFGKRTACCVRREGEVAGRKLVVIDTPGWWKNYRLSDTAEFIKQDLVLSVTKCLPGAHAFILVISIDAPFTEKNRRSVEEHLGLFGENIWKHTIVVFTRQECLEGRSIEQHIESEGDALKWLVEKCKNRYALCGHCTEGYNNATQLLGQIDSIVAGYGSHFDFDEKTFRDIEGKRRIHKERAMLRQEKITVQRDALQKYGVIPLLQEIRIFMLGWLMSGKTSASRTILGQHCEVNRKKTGRSTRNSGEVSGKQVSVVDTPGWWKYLPARYTPQWVKTELENGLTLDSRAPHAVLLAVPADTAFLEEQRKITEDNMKMFGEQVWRHTMVLFTCGDMLGDTSIEEHIESEGEPLQWLVEKCKNRYHVLSWYDKEDEVKELLEKIEEMVADNSLFKPEPKAQGNVDEETTGEPEEMQREMACLLDQKWQRMDKAMEEKIQAFWSETTVNINGSMDAYIDFSDSRPFSEDTSQQLKSEQEPGHEDLQQTREKHADQMERMREMLENEWDRWEIGITERFQRMLSDMSSEADVKELDRSIRKVVRWMHGTSGVGSTDEIDIDIQCNEDSV